MSINLNRFSLGIKYTLFGAMFGICFPIIALVIRYFQNISTIIKVVDEIAFQTNLLALNAADQSRKWICYGHPNSKIAGRYCSGNNYGG
ncbi:MAG: hypothetical protein A2504_04255 [Bdellovibrionales bacterium RIFOXYD12_FULL_39_22]|nr:MAG: hypothetical protein A2385_07570 [Bdellovibrionales bacterium RIFOXYB1_FULL_39_21]OFZ73612.1 MAG: hypothetical protein A2451_06275 [Bdellovibrionales bacterium RIFOXYC2_FULL_39_8]OFZ93507.1 MAG: hypothetical protein A2504_04255 [Bdellovibrionales bacterium RIFOXYD12_FULL_39_22]